MNLRVLSSFRRRLLGLHACARPLGSNGVWIIPCGAVHTFLLPYAIDVIFLDGSDTVLCCRHAMAPNRIAWHAGAVSVIELQAGYCAVHADYACRAGAAIERLRLHGAVPGAGKGWFSRRLGSLRRRR